MIYVFGAFGLNLEENTMIDMYTELDPPQSHYEYIADDRDSVIGVKSQALYFMDQIFDGWCTKQKASMLIDIILASKPKTIVEIGVWGGKSLVPMATALKCFGGKIYGIDPWANDASLQGVMHDGSRQFWATVDHEDVMRKLIYYIHEFGLDDHVELIRETSLDAPIIENIDVLHIDGNHSDITSYIDVTKWVPHVRKGGWIIFDDMNWSEQGYATTSRAVEYLNKHCHKLAEINDICLWGIWYKP